MLIGTAKLHIILKFPFGHYRFYIHYRLHYILYTGNFFNIFDFFYEIIKFNLSAVKHSPLCSVKYHLDLLDNDLLDNCFSIYV